MLELTSLHYWQYKVLSVSISFSQVRMKFVKDWLPVLNVCRDVASPMPTGHKPVFQELEETFLRIISTLPMSNAQELLQQCLSFSTRNVDDCPHLTSAFQTWFRRANRPLHDHAASCTKIWPFMHSSGKRSVQFDMPVSVGWLIFSCSGKHVHIVSSKLPSLCWSICILINLCLSNILYMALVSETGLL